MNEFLKEVAAVAKIACCELVVTAAGVACVFVPFAIWYTGVLP